MCCAASASRRSSTRCRGSSSPAPDRSPDYDKLPPLGYPLINPQSHISSGQPHVPLISDRRRIQFALAIALATFCALLLAAIVARNHVSGLPVFGTVSDVRLRAAADRLPVDDIVAIKATHGIRAPAYEVALFGNSRAVMVGHRHIGLDEGRFFNFAVGGTSFQQSVVMLERL